jgi:hypothetical protein
VWSPTRSFLLLYAALPTAGLAAVELATFTLRASVNRLATDSHYIWCVASHVHIPNHLHLYRRPSPQHPCSLP